MNLLEKLEQEQAAGWPTNLAPVEPDGLARRRLQHLCAILAQAWLEDDALQHRTPDGRWTGTDQPKRTV